MSTGTPERIPFQYVVLRCVPRVDREEFVNVGVVVYCQEAQLLEARCHVDEARLTALWPRLDLAAVRSAVSTVSKSGRMTLFVVSAVPIAIETPILVDSAGAS